MKELNRKFGQEFKKVREERGLSQGAVARKLKIDKSYISRLENGQINPTLSSIYKIAHALDVKMWALTKLD